MTYIDYIIRLPAFFYSWKHVYQTFTFSKRLIFVRGCYWKISILKWLGSG